MNFKFCINWMTTTLITFITMVMEFSLSTGIMRVKPVFLDTPRNITYHIGQTAVLRCTIENLGPRVVNWRKLGDEYPLTVGKMVFARREEYSLRVNGLRDDIVDWDLEIKKVDLKHAGEYECQVSSTNSYTYRIVLNVLDTPIQDIPRMTIHGTRYANLHERITLVCNATGLSEAPAFIDWFFSGNKISLDDKRWTNRIHISSYISNNEKSLISKLTIDYSRHEDKGVYICRTSEKEMVSATVHVLNAGKDITNRDVNGYHEPSSDTQNKSAEIRLDICLLFIILIMLIT